MRPKSLLLLVVAVGCGLLAMWGLNQRGEVQEQAKVKVLVAMAETIPSHEPLRDDMVEFMEVPQSELLWDAVTRKEDYVGKALNVTVTKGEMITKSKLTDKFNASTEIDEGKVVVTVKVDISTSHAGQIRPKDIVDVYTTYTMGLLGGNRGGGVETKTKRVLARIQVFSIDSIRSSSSPGKDDVLAKTVSLLVTPEQASALIMAEQKGSIHLALRNKTDETEETIPILTEAAFDKLESSDPNVESLFNTDEEAIKRFANSAEFKSILARDSETAKELQRLKDELAKLQPNKATGKTEPLPEPTKVAADPSWKITVFDGRKKETHEFVEESASEATLPEIRGEDSPPQTNESTGEFPIPQEGDQPTNTVLKVGSDDK